MPRTRALITYPNRQYLALIQRVLDTGQPFTVPCTRGQAASLRGELYAWRRAAEEDAGEARLIGLPVDRFRDLAWRITDKGLETIPTTMLVGPGLIDSALGVESVPLESPAARALKALSGLVTKEEVKS